MQKNLPDPVLQKGGWEGFIGDASLEVDKMQSDKERRKGRHPGKTARKKSADKNDQLTKRSCDRAWYGPDRGGRLFHF